MLVRKEKTNTQQQQQSSWCSSHLRQVARFENVMDKLTHIFRKILSLPNKIVNKAPDRVINRLVPSGKINKNLEIDENEKT